MDVETRNIFWGNYQLFDTNILCFDARKMDDSEYVESEFEYIFRVSTPHKEWPKPRLDR